MQTETTAENPEKNITFAKKLLKMVYILIAVEPVMVNAIAIGLAIGVLILLHFPALFPKLGKYQLYLVYFMDGLVILQTMKSATKSLFIPLVIFMVVAVGFGLLNFNPEWQVINTEWLKKLMLLGIIGVATSVLTIR